MSKDQTFASFFQAGLECSSHRRRDGVRLDLIRATFARSPCRVGDYRQCAELGLRTLRDGLRWHLIETVAGPLRLVELDACAGGSEKAETARSSGTCSTTARPIASTRRHPILPSGSRAFAMAALDVHQSVSGRGAFGSARSTKSTSWHGPSATDISLPSDPGEHGWFKRQLVRAAIMSAASDQTGNGRTPTIVWAEPLIHIAPHDKRRVDRPCRGSRTCRGCTRRTTGSWAFAQPELGGDRFAGRCRRAELLPAQPMVFRRSYHSDGAPRIPATFRHAGRHGRPLATNRSSFRRRGLKAQGVQPGLITSPTKCDRPWTRGTDVRGNLPLSGHRLSGLGQ